MKLITSFGVLLVLLQVQSFLARAQFEVPTDSNAAENSPETTAAGAPTKGGEDGAPIKQLTSDDQELTWDDYDLEMDMDAENSPEATAAGAPTTPEKKKTFAEKAKNFLRRKSPILRKKRSKSTSDLSELSRDDSEQTTPEKKKSHFAKVKSAILRKKRSKSRNLTAASDLSELSRDDSEQNGVRRKSQGGEDGAPIKQTRSTFYPAAEVTPVIVGEEEAPEKKKTFAEKAKNLFRKRHVHNQRGVKMVPQ